MLYLAIPNIINLAIRNLKGRVYMEYVEQNPLPEVCLRCEDRAGCLARGRGAVLRGMRASARAVFAAGTSEIEKKKAGNVLTNITCLCFHYTIDEHGVSSLRKGRKCERNPSGVSFAFNSRPQATVCAADRFRTNKKRHAEACLFLLVREMRLELTRLLPHAPQTCLSTYSSTLALHLQCSVIITARC